MKLRDASRSTMWLDAVDASSLRLRTFAEGLSTSDLRHQAFPSEWTAAQVLSHLGSAAEICSGLLARGLVGDLTGPQREDLLPVWGRWDAMSPTQQRAEWLIADAEHRKLLREFAEGAASDALVPYFAGAMDVVTYAGYRLSEQALHAWDVMVAFNESEAVPIGEADLLWERLDLVVSRFHDAEARVRISPTRVEVRRADVGRVDTLVVADDSLHLVDSAAESAPARIEGTSDALLRLVYGRHRSHDDLAVVGAISLDAVLSLFPGY